MAELMNRRMLTHLLKYQLNKQGHASIMR